MEKEVGVKNEFFIQKPVTFPYSAGRYYPHYKTYFLARVICAKVCIRQ